MGYLTYRIPLAKISHYILQFYNGLAIRSNPQKHIRYQNQNTQTRAENWSDCYKDTTKKSQKLISI